MRAVVLVAGLAACGRMGFDEVERAEPLDAAIDAYVATCPMGTTELEPGAATCIELVERGTIPWTDAKLACEALGRRLCTDAEWLLGCTSATGLIDMTDGEYEWVAEEAGGIAQKRGASSCDDASSHAVVDPYEFRCCVDKS